LGVVVVFLRQTNQDVEEKKIVNVLLLTAKVFLSPVPALTNFLLHLPAQKWLEPGIVVVMQL
jgi:hypothetical protein